jgi:hypothetical protein
MKAVTALASLLFLLAAPSFGQINQTRPDLCGKPNGTVPLPSGIRATIDRLQGQGNLYIGNGDARKEIRLPGVVNEVDEVCSLADGRFAVFSGSGYSAEVDLIDSAKALLLDSIWGFAPAMSPDQKWLVYRKFYPRRTELPVSEEYLLYDLSKSPTQNRPLGIAADNPLSVGRVIFPPGQDNGSADNIGVAEDQRHSSISDSLYWASDSRAVAFGDRVQGVPSIVLVKLDGHGNTTALVHHVSLSEVCPGVALDGVPLMVQHADVGPEQSGDRTVRIELFSSDSTCVPRALELHSNEFQPAKAEVHTRRKRKGSIVVQQ